jgi:hypothetical protein
VLVAYDQTLYPEFLLFEALEGIRIHEGQYRNLLLLKEDKDALIHMIMGAGKSKVITPIWALMQAKYGDQMPSMISFATGPSRTADIEKTLVVGVHGPKEVYCFLLDK